MLSQFGIFLGLLKRVLLTVKVLERTDLELTSGVLPV